MKNIFWKARTPFYGNEKYLFAIISVKVIYINCKLAVIDNFTVELTDDIQ